MHLFASKSSPVPRQLVRLLVCALLPACAQDASAGLRRPAAPSDGPEKTAAPSAPYLLACTPVALRFAEKVEPAPPILHPVVAGGPPHPAGLVEEIATANQQSALVPAKTSPADGGAAAAAAAVADSGKAAAVAAASQSPETAAPVSPGAAPSIPAVPQPAVGGVVILPDDTPREVRAEDVLLYFRMPAASSVPAPAQPPSSATYELK